MIIQKKEIATIVTQEESDGRQDDFRIQFKSVYKDLINQNIIIDLSGLKRVILKDILEFSEISDIHKAQSNKSFVMSVGKQVQFALPESIICVPTLQEALDMVEMEEIERDLGF